MPSLKLVTAGGDDDCRDNFITTWIRSRVLHLGLQPVQRMQLLGRAAGCTRGIGALPLGRSSRQPVRAFSLGALVWVWRLATNTALS